MDPEIIAAARKILQPPIAADAKKKLDALREKVPAKFHEEFNWYYEALFVARQEQYG